MPGLSIYLHSFEYNGHRYKWNNTMKKYYNSITKLEFSGPPVNAYSCIYSRKDPENDTK